MAAVNVGRTKGATAGADPVSTQPVPGFQFGAVPSPGQVDVEGPGANPDVVDVEVEDVVAFDNIGVAAPNALIEYLEEGAFGHLPGAEHFLVVPVVGKRDQDNACPRRFGVEAGGFDIQLQAVDVVVTHAPKERVSGEQQVLFDRIVEVEMGNAVCGQLSPGIQIIVPGVEVDQEPKLSAALEAHYFSNAREAGPVALFRGLDQQPRRKRMGLASGAGIKRHLVPVDQFNREDFGLWTHGSQPVSILDMMGSGTLQYSQVNSVLEGLYGSIPRAEYHK